MNYMVMECHPSYAVLLDEEGRFLKAANLHYETGQVVHDPVLMKEEHAKQRNLMRWARSGMAAAAACFCFPARARVVCSSPNATRACWIWPSVRLA